jgi:protein SCO1/2
MTRRVRFLPLLLVSVLAFALGALAALYRSGGDEVGTADNPANAPPDLGLVPEFSLTSSTGPAVGRDDLLGEPWVVDFIFTSCAGICPMMSSRMATIQNSLPDRWAGKLVSITVDPETDTPEVLQEYAQRYGARSDLWLFLTGEREEIYRLSIDGFHLGVVESSEDELSAGSEPFVHSTRMILVDAAGRVRGYYDGTDAAETARLLQDLVELKESEEGV